MTKKFFLWWVLLVVILGLGNAKWGWGVPGGWRTPIVMMVAFILLMSVEELYRYIQSVRARLKKARELEQFVCLLNSRGQVNKFVSRMLTSYAQICAKFEADSLILANGGLAAVGIANQGFTLESMLALANVEFRSAQDNFYTVYDLAAKFKAMYSLRLRDRNYKAYISSKFEEQKLELVLCVGSSIEDHVAMVRSMLMLGLTTYRQVVPKSSECKALSQKFGFLRSQTVLVLVADGESVYAGSEVFVSDIAQMFCGERPVPEPREDLE